MRIIDFPLTCLFAGNIWKFNKKGVLIFNFRNRIECLNNVIGLFKFQIFITRADVKYSCHQSKKRSSPRPFHHLMMSGYYCALEFPVNVSHRLYIVVQCHST